MEFQQVNEIKGQLIKEFCSSWNAPQCDIDVVNSPYRISPLGAHIDHQGGPVLGMTINSSTVLVFAPTTDAGVRLISKNYEGPVDFSLKEVPELPSRSWGSYVRGAVLALKEKYPLTKGVQGLLYGMLPGCGLSSSASVLLAYLSALARVNGICLEPWDLVRLTQRAENKYIGLNNGILDQTSIVFGQAKALVHIDTQTPDAEILSDPLQEQGYRILVAYSGYSRELTATGYNSRVSECREAARRLGELGGVPEAQKLGDIPPEIYERHHAELSPMLQRRARHFFTECQRVEQGVEAWRKGRLEDFGRLMSTSCQSSIQQYECGSQAIHDLQKIVNKQPGVLGSRFSGGGFGGCVVGLVAEADAARAAAKVKREYCDLHQEVSCDAKVYLASSADGVGLV